MNTKFSLALGISLIIISIISIFLKINSLVMIGISISAVIFSIINMLPTILLILEKKKIEIEYLYIIPFVCLFFFSCFSDDLFKIPIINGIAHSNFVNFISIFSFGLLFVSYYCTYIAEKKISLEYLYRLCQKEINYNNNILKILSEKNKKDITKLELVEILIENYDENMKKVLFKIKLLQLQKTTFSLEEIEMAIDTAERQRKEFDDLK